MWRQLKVRPHEAATLGELGILYDEMGRLEDAAAYHRQAADIYLELHDLHLEGQARTNLADALTRLGRHDEARHELERAFACQRPLGHPTQPWKTWAALHNLELAAGNPAAALEAHRQAVQAYLAYRRAGGFGETPGAELCTLVAQSIRQGDISQPERVLARILAAQQTAPELKATIPTLQAILHGSRDPALAADPTLDYREAAELQLLLDSLGQ
jgi:tetratricopeptide (TPR) repeat protein